MATITADVAGGNWNAGATWIGGVVPGINDDVILDASSGNVTITATAQCLTLDCTGYTGTLTLNASRALRVGYSATPVATRIVTLSASMTLTCNGGSLMYFNRSANGSRNILTAGKTLAPYVLLNAITLDDALTTSGDVECYYDFASSGYAITVPGLLSMQYGAVTLGASAVSCGQWLATNASSVDAGTSTITITSHGSAFFRDTTRTYYNIRITAGVAVAFGSASNVPDVTCNSLGIAGTGATTITFYVGSTYTLTGAKAFFSGSAGNVITMQSSTAGTAWNLVCASGTVSVDYVSLQDSAASGGATFEPGLNSTNVSGNSGWNFVAAAASGGAGTLMGVG